MSPSRSQAGQPGWRAFTLIELLVTLAIVCVLASLLMPAFGAARARARQSSCVSNMRQIGQAFAMYRADHDGIRPPYLHSMSPGHVGDKRLLLCPSDHWVSRSGYAWVFGPVRENPQTEPWPVSVSYRYPWSPHHTPIDPFFRYAESLPGRPGYAACSLHGTLHRPSWGPHYPPYEGLVLRLCFDGSVLPLMLDYRSCLNPARVCIDQESMIPAGRS